MTFSALLKILKENETKGNRVKFSHSNRSGEFIMNEEGDFDYDIAGKVFPAKFTIQDFNAKDWRIIKIEE